MRPRLRYLVTLATAAGGRSRPATCAGSVTVAGRQARRPCSCSCGRGGRGQHPYATAAITAAAVAAITAVGTAPAVTFLLHPPNARHRRGCRVLPTLPLLPPAGRAFARSKCITRGRLVTTGRPRTTNANTATTNTTTAIAAATTATAVTTVATTVRGSRDTGAGAPHGPAKDNASAE